MMKIANFDSQQEYVTVELYRTNGEVASVVVICFGETKLSWHAPRICQFVRKYYWIPRYVTSSVDYTSWYPWNKQSCIPSSFNYHKALNIFSCKIIVV